MAKLQPGEEYKPPIKETPTPPPPSRAPQPWLEEYGIPEELWPLFEHDERPWWEYTDEPEEPPPLPAPLPEPPQPFLPEPTWGYMLPETVVPTKGWSEEERKPMADFLGAVWNAWWASPPGRVTADVLGWVGMKLSIPARKTKQALGALQYILESGTYEDAAWQSHPKYVELLELHRLPFTERLKPEVRKRHLELVAEIQRDVYGEQKFSPDEMWRKMSDMELWGEAWKEGEGFRYTHWLNPELRLRYEELRAKGMAPAEAGDYSEVPAIELLGEMVLDPLNLLSLAGWGNLYGDATRALGKKLKGAPYLKKLFRLSKSTQANLAYYRARDTVRVLARLFPEASVDELADMAIHYADDVADQLPLYHADRWRRTAELLDDVPPSLVRRANNADDLARGLAQLAYQRTADILGLDSTFLLRGPFFGRARAFFTDLWLGSRPAWIINNWIDNSTKLIIEGVNPFGHTDELVRTYEYAIGPIPAEVEAALARGLRGPTTRGGVVPVLKHYTGLIYRQHDKMEAAARTRVYLSRFGRHYDDTMRATRHAVRTSGLSDEVADALVARLRSKRWWSPQDLDDAIRAMETGEVTLYRVELLDEAVEVVPEAVRDVVVSRIRTKAEAAGGIVTLDDVDDAFSTALKVVEQDEARRLAAARNAVWHSMEIPRSPKAWVRHATESFDITTKRGALDALNDLARNRFIKYAQDQAALDDFIKQLDTMPPAARSEAWETFLKNRRASWKRFNATERQAYELFLEQLDPELAAQLRPELEALVAAHEGMGNFFAYQSQRYRAAAQRAMGQPPIRGHRIWRTAQREVSLAEQAMLTPLKQQASEAWARIRGIVTSSGLAGEATETLAGPAVPWLSLVDEASEAVNAQKALTREILDGLDAWYDDLTRNYLTPTVTIRPSPEDIETLRALRPQLVQQAREGLDAAIRYGLDETNRILFDYIRNYWWDDLAERFVPYWKWPSRNIVQAADAYLRHPKVMAMLHRARDYVALVNERDGLRTRLKYSLRVPGVSTAFATLLRRAGVEEHIEPRVDPFRFISWFGSMPGSTPYKQRELEKLASELREGPAPIIEEARRWGEQFGIGLYPWWEFTLGYMGVFGDDWYPRQVIPWSRTIEYFTGVNPDYTFHKVLTTILSELGVPRMITKGYDALGLTPPKVDLIEWGKQRPDRWLNFSAGRRLRSQLIGQYLRGVPAEDITADVKKAKEDALTLAFLTEAFGHTTGIYFKEWSEEEAVSKAMGEEYRYLPSKAARKEWYEKYPWWGEHSRSWDAFADTPDRIKRGERRAILSEFYSAYNALRDQHAQERQALFRASPMVRWKLDELKARQREEIEALEKQYTERLAATCGEGEVVPPLWSWNLFPQHRYNKLTGEWEETYSILPEEYREHHLKQLAGALSSTLPQRAWFVQEDGSFDAEGYRWARDRWFAALPGLEDYAPGPPANKTWERAARTPAPVLQGLIQRMVAAGMPGEAARQFVTLGLTRDDLETAWMENDTPEEALQNVYYERVVAVAAERAAEIRKIKDPDERSQAWENLFASFPPMDASALIWDVYFKYRDVKPGWTPLFLAQALEGIRLPSYEEYLQQNKTGRAWLEGAINQLYFEQHWRNRKLLRNKIPALDIVARRRQYRREHPDLNLPSSYDYAIISLGELKDVLNALERLLGRPLTDWEDVPLLSVPSAEAVTPEEVPTPPAHEGVIPTRPAPPPPTREDFLELTTDEWTGSAGVAGKYGLIRLLSPEELAEADEAQQINEAAWAARERGDFEEANRLFAHPLWIKWYGNTPKALFWREYRKLVPPGWRGKEVRQHPLVAAILDKGVRGFFKPEAYEEALQVIYDWVDANPDALEGTPEEWEQAKQEAQEYYRIPREDREARQQFVRDHPIFAKYYTGGPSRGRPGAWRGGWGGGYRRRFIWAEFVADAGATVLRFLEGYWSGRRKLTPTMESALRALHDRYGQGMEFEAWLEWLRSWWVRYGRSFRAPRAPRLPVPRTGWTRRKARGAGAVAKGVRRPRR